MSAPTGTGIVDTESATTPFAWLDDASVMAPGSVHAAGVSMESGGVYPGNPDPVTTFGVKATVVTSATVEGEVIHAVVAAVFDNLDQFKLAHPAFGSLEPATMAADALSAPLHAGAARYFAAAGWR